MQCKRSHSQNKFIAIESFYRQSKQMDLFMDKETDARLEKMDDLLQHTGEFIAYFELVDAKMKRWSAELEQQAKHWNECSQSLNQQLSVVNELLSTTGISDFRKGVEKALSQGEANVQLIDKQCHQHLELIQKQEEKIRSLTEISISKMEQRAALAVQSIIIQLSKYDAYQFHRIANESCERIAYVAHNAVNNSNKLLSKFQWRFSLFAVFTTLLTAFVISLYLNDELPWEMHHQARNERHAGKVLLQAWPNLSQEEKAKILSDEG